MPIYMKWGENDIKGDVTAAGHEGWIELSSIQFGPSRRMTSPTGGTAEKGPPVQEIVATKLLDVASTALSRASLWGEGKKVVIHFMRPARRSRT